MPRSGARSNVPRAGVVRADRRQPSVAARIADQPPVEGEDDPVAAAPHPGDLAGAGAGGERRHPSRVDQVELAVSSDGQLRQRSRGRVGIDQVDRVAQPPAFAVGRRDLADVGEGGGGVAGRIESLRAVGQRQAARQRDRRDEGEGAPGSTDRRSHGAHRLRPPPPRSAPRPSRRSARRRRRPP